MKNISKKKRTMKIVNKSKKTEIKEFYEMQCWQARTYTKTVTQTTKLKILVQMTLGKKKFCLQDQFYNPLNV